MFTRLTAAAIAALTVASLALAPSAGASHDTSARRRPACGQLGRPNTLEAIGLTDDQRLVCFRVDHPERAQKFARVRGLQMDTRLVGIDVRPATNILYGLGEQGGVYTIDTNNGRATLASRLNVPLQGMSFGVDFNPAADRLRVVSDTGQNLRVNVVDGTTTADGTLAYTAGTPATGVVGAMYTNNDADPNTNTTLFDVDSTLDQIAIQSPPNAGSLVATGKLGFDTNEVVAADIYSKVRDGSTVANWAFVSLSDDTGSTFFKVDLLTGRATSLGEFATSVPVVGLAIPTNQF
jgi:Domain of unknown function (DUF4394)